MGNRWGNSGNSVRLYFLGIPKSLQIVIAAMKLKDTCSFGRKVMTNLDSILKSRHISLPKKVHLVKAIAFPVVMYVCESQTIKSWGPKNWCFWTIMSEKTSESPLDYKEIEPVHPKGNQSWIFIGRTEAVTLILWPRDAKSRLIWKDPDPGKDWRWEERGMTKDEMVLWHHRLDGHEFE